MKRKLYFILAALVILGSLSFTACNGNPDGVYNLEFRTIRYAKAGLYVGNNFDYNDITYDFDYSLAKTTLETPQDKESKKKTVTMKEGDLITVKHEPKGPDNFVVITAKRNDNNKYLKIIKVDPWDDFLFALRQFTMPASDVTLTVRYADQSITRFWNHAITYPNKNDAADVLAKGGYLEKDRLATKCLPGMELYLLATPNPGKKLSSFKFEMATADANEVVFTPVKTINLPYYDTDDENIKTFTMPSSLKEGDHIIITASFVDK